MQSSRRSRQLGILPLSKSSPHLISARRRGLSENEESGGSKLRLTLCANHALMTLVVLVSCPKPELQNHPVTDRPQKSLLARVRRGWTARSPSNQADPLIFQAGSEPNDAGGIPDNTAPRNSGVKRALRPDEVSPPPARMPRGEPPRRLETGICCRQPAPAHSVEAPRTGGPVELRCLSIVATNEPPRSRARPKRVR